MQASGEIGSQAAGVTSAKALRRNRCPEGKSQGSAGEAETPITHCTEGICGRSCGNHRERQST